MWLDNTLQEFSYRHEDVGGMFKVVERVGTVHGCNDSHVSLQLRHDSRIQFDRSRIDVALETACIKCRQSNDFSNFIKNSASIIRGFGRWLVNHGCMTTLRTATTRHGKYTTTSFNGFEMLSQQIHIVVNETLVPGTLCDNFGDLIFVTPNLGLSVLRRSIARHIVAAATLLTSSDFDPVRLKVALAFRMDFFFPWFDPVSFARLRQDVGRGLRALNESTLSRTFHSGCGIDGIAKQLETRTFSSQNSCSNGATM
mmetsp:Transcript_4369/g.9008  ORF Transcript_4369/g.9008 Transcript_4369/m.9008 type:complete len:255 (-) Transcript_4369:2036-2800(-)